jgi:uncharacterized protein YaaR (DUF327 family)
METEGTATPQVTGTAEDVASSTNVNPDTAIADAVQEVSAPEVEKETVEDENFSRKFTALSKREADLRKREDELKARNAGYSSVDEYKKLAKTNVQKWLEETGVSFDEITEYYLNGAQNKDPKVLEVEEKLTKLEKQILEKEEQAAELERRTAVANYKSNQKAHIDSKASEYELIAATNNYDLVYDVTKQHFDKTGKILTHDEAAQMVENYLEKEVDKVLKASKIKNKFSNTPKTETGAKTEQAKETIKTLNNSMTSSAASPSSKPLSREESLERVASMLKFT